MSVKVCIPFLSTWTDNQSVVEVDGETIGECIEHLVKQFPNLKLYDEHGELFPYLVVSVNGELAHREALAKRVKDGDEIHILPMIAGG